MELGQQIRKVYQGGADAAALLSSVLGMLKMDLRTNACFDAGAVDGISAKITAVAGVLANKNCRQEA